MTNVLIILLMTFCIWGWIFLWPILRIDSPSRKAFFVYVLVLFMLVDLVIVFSVGYPVTTEGVTAVLENMFYSHSNDLYIVWIGLVLGMIFTFFRLDKVDKIVDVEQFGGYFNMILTISFFSTLFVVLSILLISQVLIPLIVMLFEYLSSVFSLL